MRACQACGSSIEGRRSNVLFCSQTCKERVKKQRQRGTVVGLPARSEAGDGESPLVASLVESLRAAERLETDEGQHALFLARRLVGASRDTGSAVASLSKEYRAARAEALAGAQVERSALDELRARRDAKRGA